MHAELVILQEIAIIFGLSAAALFICAKLKIPTIIGFLVAGMAAGPHGFGLVRDTESLELLAEIGVVLLLFTIGVEFSIKSIIRIKKAIFFGGGIQVAVTAAIVTGIAYASGANWEMAVFIGFLIAISSTAIVLKLMQARGEMESAHGQTALAFAIFQDIIVIPMMLSVPLLAGEYLEIDQQSIPLAIGIGVAVIVFMFVAARWGVPALLHQVVRTRDKELFLLTVVMICFVVALITSSLGLSLALGAFVAGLIISESEYSHHALGNILPFRDVFLSFFFVSIGMLFNIATVLENPLFVIGATIAVLVGKALIAGLASFSLGRSFHTSVIAGLGVSQVGEFSFILAVLGLNAGVITSDIYQIFLAISIFTMGATPFLLNAAPNLARRITARFPSLASDDEAKQTTDALKDHIIIVGYGVNGRNLATAAKDGGIPYTVLEMNPDTVRDEREKGIPIAFGDATQPMVLEDAGIKRARALVVVISDASATRRITEAARSLCRTVHIVVRTRFVTEVEPLLQLGADEVVPEEFETSVEIFTRVLHFYHVPERDISEVTGRIRDGHYSMLRAPSEKKNAMLAGVFSTIDTATIRLDADCHVIGQSIRGLDLRKKYGATLLAIRRDENTIINPPPDTALESDDTLVFIGEPGSLASVSDFLLQSQDV